MPEDSEQEQQKRYDKCAGNKKAKTRRIRFTNPQQVATFLVSHKPSFAYLSAAKVKKMFPNIFTSVQKLNELMQDPEYFKAVNEQIPEINKRQASGMFDMVLQQYFEGQMQLKRGDVLCPDAKAITIFGQYSGRFDPMQKIDISGGMNFTEEKKQEFTDEVVKAIANRANRLKNQEGGGNGN